MEQKSDTDSRMVAEKNERQLAEVAFTKYFEEECAVLDDKIFKQSMLALVFLAVAFTLLGFDFTFSIIVLLGFVVVCTGILVYYPRWKVTRDFYAKFPEHTRWLKSPLSGK